jgi:diguanylate cyclase (GGDEF)-like protein
VLRAVSARIANVLRPTDTLARFGGDEFVVVAEDLDDEMLAELVTRLRDAVAAPIDVAGVTVELAVTVGAVTVTGADGETADSLVAAADVDMYRRKPGSSTTPDMAGPRSRGG